MPNILTCTAQIRARCYTQKEYRIYQDDDDNNDNNNNNNNNKKYLKKVYIQHLFKQ